MAVIGWLTCGVGLIWLSILWYFVTMDTFSEGWFSGGFWYRLGAIAFTLILGYGWWSWVSVIEVKI